MKILIVPLIFALSFSLSARTFYGERGVFSSYQCQIQIDLENPSRQATVAKSYDADLYLFKNGVRDQALNKMTYTMNANQWYRDRSFELEVFFKDHKVIRYELFRYTEQLGKKERDLLYTCHNIR